MRSARLRFAAALAGAIVGCGGPQTREVGAGPGPEPDDRPADLEPIVRRAEAAGGWQRWVAVDGAFELWTPDGATLEQHPTEAAFGQAVTVELAAERLVLTRLHPGAAPAQAVEEARAQGADVTVEVDETVVRDGHEARHLRHRVRLLERGELIQDPATGNRAHAPDRPSTRLFESLFFRGRGECIELALEVDDETHPDVTARLRALLDRFRLLDTI